MAFAVTTRKLASFSLALVMSAVKAAGLVETLPQPSTR